MKNTRILSGLFGLLGVVLAVLTAAVCLWAVDAPPVLVVKPAAAAEKAEALMAAVCEGDYEKAEDMLYGSPDLGMDRLPSDEVGRILWDAFQQSFSYELTGDCYATDSGVAQDVTLQFLDFSSVTASLGERAQALLVERVEAAEDADSIYDENGDYREDFVLAVLRDVTLAALEEDARMTQRTLSLNLVCKQGQWWVVADQALLSAVSGGTAG